LHIPDLDHLVMAPAPPVRLTGDGVLRDVMAARYALQDNPPRIAAALAHCARARDLGDEGAEALDYAFRELAVAAMANMSRLRAAYPELAKP
jgi:hypothetical protein